ncbi:hypothetical protein T05_6844 [Trichinella murrelli]|uniref:Uncharacterized protein n=1 Tax=Trichinella murrelli TaxID=144512 RepID=A0A0V0SPT5_9BILA|nr:hypothetical protein T05_6844 [Trichinella murrelli]
MQRLSVPLLSSRGPSLPHSGLNAVFHKLSSQYVDRQRSLRF